VPGTHRAAAHQPDPDHPQHPAARTEVPPVDVAVRGPLAR
jgi:hypothetical protein